MLPVLYSEVNLLCILFLLLIGRKLENSSYAQDRRRLFKYVLLSNCFLFAVDIVWIFVDKGVLPFGIQANWALNTVYYITSGAVSFFWFVYSESVQKSKLVRSRLSVFLCSVPMLLLTLLSLISIKTGWLFSIDASNNYLRGPLYSLQLVLSYGYIIFTAVKALALSFKAVSYYKKLEYRTLAAFVVPSLIAGGIQVFFPDIPILCVGTTFGILFVFLTMQEQMISNDGLTGLNNRIRMTSYLSEMMARYDGKTRLFLVMMDIDYFKQINDRYGHIEGDRALSVIAEALKACSSNHRYFIARYGGDEFAAVCDLEQDESIDDFCENIRNEILRRNKENPYTLSLSFGYAEYYPGIGTDIDFIKLADAELYKAKQAR